MGGRQSHAAVQRRAVLRMDGAAGTAAGGGGDLSGGNNVERNKQIERIRNMFVAEAAGAVDTNVAENAARLGMLLDLPLCATQC